MRAVTTCGAIIRNEAGEILILLRSASDARRPVRWDLPGGHADAGETLEDALKREVLEEIGLKVGDNAPKLWHAFSDTFDNEVSVNWLFFRVEVSGSQVTLSPEHSEFRWVGIDEAIELIDYEPKKRALVYIREHDLLNE